MTAQFAPSRVTGTAEAVELIESLRDAHGPLAFAATGPSCDGGELLCLTRAELLPDPDDIRIGAVGGAPIYVEGARYELWGRPQLVVDVAGGPAAGIALEGLEHRHFVARAGEAPRRFHPRREAATAHR
jgi:uncharacterized protein